MCSPLPLPMKEKSSYQSCRPLTSILQVFSFTCCSTASCLCRAWILWENSGAARGVNQITAKADRVSDALRYVTDGIFPSFFSFFLKSKGRRNYDIDHDCADQSLEWMLCVLCLAWFFFKGVTRETKSAVTQSLPWENIITKTLDVNYSSEIPLKAILFPCLLLHGEGCVFSSGLPLLNPSAFWCCPGHLAIFC